MSLNPSKRVFDFFPLEDRILLSADGFHPGDGVIDGEVAYLDQMIESMRDQEGLSGTPQTPETNGESNDEADSNALTAEGQANSSDESTTKSLEVIVIDAGVDDANQLISDLRDRRDDETQWVIVELSADQDGVNQISQVLAELSDVNAIHLLSHSDGEGLQLGNTTLVEDSLTGYAGAIAGWSDGLADGADILIYGCDLASTEQGRLLIDSLAALCQCDVAASDDATGHESLGGDWDLEYNVGSIQTNVFLSDSAKATWQDTLAVITVTTLADENDGNTTDITSLNATPGGSGISLREAIIAANNTAGPDTIVLGDGTYALTITGQHESSGATGDLDITGDITITGNGATDTTINAASLLDRIFHVQVGGTLTIDGLTLTGAASGTELGAAVFNEGTFNATDVVLTGNSATGHNGGAIASTGTTTLDRVAVINNAAIQGGGIYVSAGTTTLNNVTVSGNVADFDGGGIRAINGGTVVNIDHSTIADNEGTAGNGGGISITDATVNLSSSIVADNMSQFSGQDVTGTIVSGGDNLVEHNTGVSGAIGSDILGSDPGLSTLTTIGETFVHTFDSSSLAHDGATGSTEVLDQTGQTRDADRDIGAYEFIEDPTSIVATSNTDGGLSINADGGFDTYLVADDGGAILGGLSSFTYELRFSTTDTTSQTPLMSYASGTSANEMLVFFVNDEISFHLRNQTLTLTAINYNTLRDGNPHQIALTWDNAAGDWAFYIDGSVVESGSGFATGHVIGSGGTLLFGQEQDSVEGGFVQEQVFKGSLYHARVFSQVRSSDQIHAAYQTSLPYDEPSLLAQWDFTNLSTDGVITESVEGNNLSVRHVSGYSQSQPILNLAVDENVSDGTVVASVAGVDPEREALIATLLASDPNLVYSSETGKFYKAIGSVSDWATAESNAMATNLNGVGGQLATIQNATEQEILASFASNLGVELFLGGTDLTAEGTWRWQANGIDAESFWIGQSNGRNVDGAYVNWQSGSEPNNNSGNQHYLSLQVDGTWDDEALNGGNDNGYIIEWDADSVLDATQALTYTMLSQTVAGAFSIDSDRGQIIVADGSLLDYESNASHIIDLRVTDADGNTRDESFTIVINDINESFAVTSDLSSGIEINQDGGNDAYLIANDGGSLFAGLSALTFESSLRIDDQNSSPTLFSYYVGGDEAQLQLNTSDQLVLHLNGSSITSTNAFSQLVDGDVHHVAVTWDNTHGDLQFYIDGELAESFSGFQAGTTLDGGGEFVLGNDQSGLDSGYQADRSLHGTFYDVRLWNEARSDAEISLNYQHKLDLTPAEATASGLIANWQMVFNGSSEVIDIVSEGTTNNRLQVSHASGTGFSPSTATADLHVSETSTNGTSVGFIVPSQSAPSVDLVSDGLFLEATPSSDQYGVTGTFGDWSVNSGSIDLFATSSWESRFGGRMVNLDGGSPGSISQSIATTAGTQYQVVFSLTGDFSGGDPIKDLRVSADGQFEDFSISENSHWSWGNTQALESRQFTFTADSASTELTFASLESAGSLYGPYIGDIRVIEIPAAITTILDADGSLQYDTNTHKFYRYVNVNEQFSSAQANAIAATVNGASGQLVTIRSAYENDLVHQMISDDIWIGASDESSEGDWRWLQGNTDADAFWSGGIGGTAVDGHYTNWNGGEPNNTTSVDPNGEDAAEMFAGSGRWNDLPDHPARTQGYVIEWDADQVLSGYTFALTDDAGGRFSIDASSGEIIVADASLLDFETFSSHTITAEVTDASGDTYTEVMTIAVDDAPGDAQFTIPIGQSFDEDTTLVFSNANGNAIVLNDGSSQTPTLTTTLSVSSGNLTLASTTGITFLAGTNNGESILTIAGTETAINNALDGLQYDPIADDNGFESLVISTGSTPITEGNLYARYEFEDGSLIDQSGNGYDGTAISDPAIAVDASRGDGIQLDSNDGVSIAGGTSGLADEVTIAAWVNLDPAQQDAVLLSLGDEFYVTLDVSAPGGGLGITAGAFSSTTSNPAHEIAGDGWHHIAATIDDVADQITLYLDGVLIATIDTSLDIDWGTAPSPNVTIGGLASGAMPLVGSLDDVRIYDAVLSESEVIAVMGDQGHSIATVGMTVRAINDDPVNAGSLPSDILVTIDTLSNVNLTDVDFSDVDAGSNAVTVTLATTTGGELTASSGGGILVGGSANARTFTGSISDLNAYFDDVTNIRYQHGTPGTTGNDADTLSLTINDGGNTGTGGGGNVALGSVNVDISPPNQAPVLSPYGPVYNTSEDAAPLTASVGTVLWSSMSDPDPGSVEGIAVFGFTGSGGTLEYSLDGSNWFAFPSVSSTSALLLRSSDQFRFTPSTENGGVLQVDYRGWDQTSGTAGTLADTSINGGSTAYSSASDRVQVNLTSINDAPVLDNSGTMTLTTISEDDTNNAGDSVASIIASAGGDRITDVDTGSVEGIAITNQDNGNGTWQYSTNGGSTWSDFGAVSDNAALLLRSTDLVRFEPNGANGTSPDFTFRAWDQTTGSAGAKVDASTNGGTTAFSTATEAVSITVTDINDEQVIATNTGATVVEGSSGNVISNTQLRTTDADHSSSQLVYTVDSIPSSGTLYRNGVALAATDTFTQADIDANLITYTHDGSEASSDSFNFTVDDGTGASSSGTFTLGITNVNDAPVAASIEGTTLNAPENGSPVAVTSTLTVSDVDDANLESATIQITGNYFAGEDLLSFTNQNGITGSWDAGSGTMTLTGTASVADYQTALRSVTYENLSLSPSTPDRTVSIVVNDGSINSNAQARTVSVLPVNDDPTNTGSLPADVTVVEDVRTSIDLSLIDLDDSDAGSADLTLTLSTSTGGLLSATSGGGVVITGDGTDTLTLVGSLNDLNSFLDVATNLEYLHGTANTFGDDADTILVVINDGGASGNGGGGDVSLGSINVDITAVNDTPTASGENFEVRSPDTELSIDTSGLIVNDTDLDGDTLSVVLVSSTSNGTLSLEPGGVLLYTPASGYIGTDTFSYHVTDGSATSNVVTVVIDVEMAAPYTPPTTTPDSEDSSSEDSDTETENEESESESESEESTEMEESTSEDSSSESSSQSADAAAAVPPPAEAAGQVNTSEAGVAPGKQGEAEQEKESAEAAEEAERERIERISSTYQSSRGYGSGDGAFNAELVQLDRILQEDLRQAIIWSQWDNADRYGDNSMASVQYASFASAGIGMFSVGYVMWALRGGAMVGVFASALPAWRFIDPIAMLSAYRDFRDNTEDGLESLIRVKN
ncbi:DUF4347 domain-containing protein [Roseiconus lacunae]|nr:DUF4347 domain-containing protein [Roseiconus lacunae]